MADAAGGSKYWRDEALGSPREIQVAGGAMRVFDTGGDASPIVFVHGALVNANLWRHLVPKLSGAHRCISLDLPLGSHELTMPDADISPIGLADMIADAIQALGLDQPTIVANDSGGALTQIALSRHPDLAGRVVLTSCDAYDNFPPRFFRVVLWPTRFPRLARSLFQPLRIRALRSTPIAFGWLTKAGIDDRTSDSFILPILTGPGQAEDFARIMRTVNPKQTHDAIAKLRSYERPVLIAWSRDDRFFPPPDAERLAADIPGARLEWIDDAYTFSMLDQPERLAGIIDAFVRETAGSEPVG